MGKKFHPMSSPVSMREGMTHQAIADALNDNPHPELGDNNTREMVRQTLSKTICKLRHAILEDPECREAAQTILQRKEFAVLEEFEDKHREAREHYKRNRQ